MDNHNDKSKTKENNYKNKTIICKFTFEQPSSTKRRSATNLIYCAIDDAFIPINAHGNASVRNSISIFTASRRISSIRSTLGL